MLIGREAGRATVDRLLAEARAGRSGALVIRGEPGIGKSALLAYAFDRAADLAVLRASGMETESELPFAALHELCRPVNDRIERLPPGQARALRSALALDPVPVVDRFAVYAATLSLLAEVAEDGPLLCLVDDAHWLDTGSAEALVFAARRMAAEGIVVLFAARTGEARTFSAPGIAELELGGLGAADARTLLERAAVELPERVADRLVSLAGGNPLALLELPATLTEAERSGRAPLGEPVRVGTRIERAFLGRVRALPPEAQTGLLVAAASETGEAGPVGRAIERLSLSAEALGPAEATGLIGLDAGRWTFRHPLVRSAVYGAAPPAERRAAHQALADTSTGSSRAWHLAAAAVGPDEPAAVALDAAAAEARERGAYAAAGRASARAAELTADPEARARRLLAAGEAYWIGGQAELALRAATGALELTTDPLLRADIQLLRGRILTWTQNVMAAHELLVAEATRVEPHDRARAAMLMTSAVMSITQAGNCPGALDTSHRAVSLAASVGGPPYVLARLAHGTSLVLNGNSQEAAPIIAEWATEVGGIDLPEFYGPFVAGAHTLVWIEQFETARFWFDRIIQARDRGILSALPFALAGRADLDFRVGDWESCLVSATEALQLSVDFGQLSTEAWCLFVLGRLAAARGLGITCRQHLDQATELAGQAHSRSFVAYVHSIAGLLELGGRRYVEAIHALEPMVGLVVEEGLKEPAIHPWAPDLIEAYIHVERRADAEAVLRTFEAQAERTGRTWALAAAARCRGLFAPDDAFEAEFETALRWHDRTPTPFERARTLLCFGERLRRAGRRSEARDRLREALTVFDRLGAAPWAERTRSELTASGEAARRRDPTATESLTAQELQVALLVATGVSNREAASALFLSPKTIEFHLGNAYGKLGLHSRTQLAHWLASEGR